MASVALMHVDFQRRRKLRELMLPVRQQGERCDDENFTHRGTEARRVSLTTIPSSAALRLCARNQDPPDDLDGLAEAHVVREQRTEAVRGQELQPFDTPFLIVSQLPFKPLYLNPLDLLNPTIPQLIDQPAQPAVGFHLLELQQSDMAEAHREGQRIRLLVDAFLQRAQSLLENAAVDFDPAVAEKDQRRPLVEQEADLVGRHRFPRHANGQLEA